MIRQIKYRYGAAIKSDFTRSIATMATGTVVSQLIPLVMAPVVARLFSPTDYAILAAYSAVTLMFTIVATGMFDAALILDQDDAQAVNTGALAVMATLGVTVLSLLISLFFSGSIADFMGVESLRYWVYLIPVSVLLSSFSQTLLVWNNRRGRYKRLASNKIYLTLITTAITLAFGFLGLHEYGLIVSLIAGQAISFAILCVQTFRADGKLFDMVHAEGLKRSWHLHKDFPRYNMPQGFLDAFKESGMVWVISFYFGSASLGSFSFARSMVMRPLQVIGSSVSQVFYQRSSKLYNQTGNITKLASKTFFSLLGIGLPFALVIFFFGEVLFSLVFGAAWSEAGVLSALMVFWLLVNFIASPFGNVPLILKKQKQFFLWSLIYSIVPMGIIFLTGYSGYSMREAVVCFSLSSIIIMSAILLWIRSILFKSVKKTKTDRYDIELTPPASEKTA